VAEALIEAKQLTLKNSDSESKPKAFIDNAPYPKWIKSS